MFSFVSKCAVLITGLVLLSNNAFAQNKLESWYTYWGLGYADVKYPDELDDLLQDLEDAPGVDHVSIGLDFLGFYWPLNEQTILGVIINGTGDRYEVSGSSMQINSYTFAFSAMRFLNNTIGKGIFVRAEAGPARLVVDTDDFGTESSDWGFGGLIGGGFGFNVSPGTRILLNVNYAVRKVEGDSYNTFGLSIGGLF